jgi:hypothetical protein
VSFGLGLNAYLPWFQAEPKLIPTSFPGFSMETKVGICIVYLYVKSHSTHM